MAIYVKAEAGSHNRINCPVSLKINKSNLIIDHNRLRDVLTGKEYLLNIKEEDDYYLLEWIIDYLPANEEINYSLICRDPYEKPLMKSILKDESVDMYFSDNFYTSYYFGKKTVKPYLGPVTGAFGDAITRIDFAAKEHPHHRSIWFSHGNVNSVDFWNEPEGRHGRILNRKISDVENTDIYTSFKAENIWTDFDFRPILDDVTRVKLYNTCTGHIFMDVALTLKASYEDVKLGATKEAGPVAVRVNDAMMVKKTGMITNGYGGINEEEIWMKRAPWCDYSGVVNSRIQGIAIFDDPVNYGYPSYWHSRNYGLMAPNNYHIPGDYILKRTEEICFSYRIAVHMGDCSSAGIRDSYHDYINPPKTSFLSKEKEECT